ncbi:MAG: protein adenylyltransferase SelO family protein, partial [Gammaproteobacteria bacterium]
YGPYGWIDDYDPDWTPNTTDAGGRRYRFGHQARIAHWNLAQLANALVPLFQDTAPLEEGLEHYVATFLAADRANIATKLGLRECREDDEARMRALYGLMQSAGIDMTIFFRRLADVDLAAPSLEPVAEAFYDEGKRTHYEAPLLAWLRGLAARVAEDGLPGARRREQMHAANPCYVPRNYLAQQAIDAAEQGDLAPLHALLEVLRQPYTERPGREAFAARRPEWARHKPGCSMLSCSS